MDIKKIIEQGVTFKKTRDESETSTQGRYNKPKGKTISGAAKMRAKYKSKKAAKSSKYNPTAK